MDLYATRTQWRLLEPMLAKAGIAVTVEERNNSVKNTTSYRLTVAAEHERAVNEAFASLDPLVKAEQPKHPVFVAFFEDGSRDGWVAIAAATEADARRVMARRFDGMGVTRVIPLDDYEAEMGVLDPDDYPGEGQWKTLEYGS